MWGRKARQLRYLKQRLRAEAEANNELRDEVDRLRRRLWRVLLTTDARRSSITLVDDELVFGPDPTRRYVIPRESPGTDRLTDTTAPVLPCLRCGQTHRAGEVCGHEIEEAA